jgi:catechol 2,3-dioxygenase-like lactoylglutathione lyase family enzyme
MRRSSFLKLPRIHHVGVVVRDIDEGIKYYSSNFDMGPFNIIDSSRKDAFIRGRLGDYRIKQAFAKMGQTLLELNQVVEGRPVQQEFLEKNGEGVHHLGFVVNDLDTELASFREKGFNVIQSYATPSEGVRFAFLETKVGGLVFELVWLPEEMRHGVPQ